jgi:hypothetical protein
MALIEFHETAGDEGNLALDQRAYSRRFWGRSNSADDRSTDVLASRLVPQLGERDPFDSSAIIKRVTATRKQRTTCLWDFLIHSDTEEEQEHPLERAAEIDWASEQVLTTTVRDVKGKPILTTAGSFLPMDYEDSRWVISVQKNLGAVPRPLLDFNNVLNNSTITVDGISFPKLKLMCKQLRIGRRQRELYRGKTVTYRPVAFNLFYRPDGWQGRAPNVDFVQVVTRERPIYSRIAGQGDKVLLDPDGNPRMKKYPALERILIDGEYPCDPQPLDRDGRMLRRREDGTVNVNEILFLERDIYRPKSFQLLPLK